MRIMLILLIAATIAAFIIASRAPFAKHCDDFLNSNLATCNMGNNP